MLNSTLSLSESDRQRFEDLLPWYVNGTLAPAQRAWMDGLVAQAPQAAALLVREQALSRAVPGILEPVAQDAGLAQLMARVKADRTASGAHPPRARTAGGPRLWDEIQRWLTRPAWATAMAVVVLAQTGALGWFLQERQGAQSEIRSTTVTEVRTLRITFQPAATEAQIRAALLAAGARIVGGPNQLGEYWVASAIVSLDEMKVALAKTGLTMSMEVDLLGPRGL